MRAVVFQPSTGSVSVEDLPAPVRQPGHVLLRNRYSLLSTGTERSVVAQASRGLVAKIRDRPDQVAKAVQKLREVGPFETAKLVRERLEPPASLLGYSCAGEVLDVGAGASDLVPQQLSAAGGAGYAVHAEVIGVPANLCAPVPDGVSAQQAAFATVGAIALRGIHQARAEPGSRVAVIGLGLVGQLSVRLLQAYGYETVGIDLDESMVRRSAAGGVPSFVRSRDDLLEEIGRSWRGHRADAVLLTAATSSTDPIELAGAMARDRAVVVVVGDVSVSPQRHAFYHKELEIRYSRSYGPGRYDALYEEGGVAYPEGFVPWDEHRNLAEILRLFATGSLEIETLSPLVVPIDEAAVAYERLNDTSERQVAILLEYPDESPRSSRGTRMGASRARTAPVKTSGTVSLGVLGAGSFATGVLFPLLQRNPSVRLSWLATGRGITAYNEAQKWKFGAAVADLEEGLASGQTDGALVLSRHDSHAAMTSSLLRRGVTTFCEKPLSLTEAELEEVSAAYLAGGGRAMVGFNRRFSPLLGQLKGALSGRGPLQLSYRVFAGQLDPGHWYFDPVQGGRLLGEVCHFVDALSWIVGSAPTLVTAYGGDGHRDPVTAESVTVLLQFEDGSAATLVYAGHSPPGPPKELLEVAGRGVAGRIDDFKSLDLWIDGRSEHSSSKTSEKGHNEEMSAFVELVQGRSSAETSFEFSVASTLATCRIARSLAESEAQATIPESPALKELLGSSPRA